MTHWPGVTEKSAVPEWFGRAEADRPAVNRASSGCVLPLMLLALAAAAAAAVFGMIEHQRAERLERQLRAATVECQQLRASGTPVPPAPLPVEPTPAPIADAPVPTPTPGADPTAALSAAEIMKVMNRSRPAMKACYNASPVDARGSGRIVLTLSVGANGSVTQVKAERTGSLLPAVSTCVTQVARSLKFPESSGATTVNYPVVFQAE